MIKLIGMEFYSTLFFLAFASDFKGFSLFEKNLGRLRVFRCDLSRDIIISQVDDPIEVVFRDVGIFHEVAKLSHIPIHELFCSLLGLLLPVLQHQNIMEEYFPVKSIPVKKGK
jgi:hypothetical protein